MIVIIDYGMGNLRSVQKAIEAVGREAQVSERPEDVRAASHVILPGVGAFEEAMRRLDESGLGEAFREAVGLGKPCLGVCLGLQLLFEESEEDGIHKGLGLLPGRVIRFTPAPGLKIPHMGWNTLEIARPAPILKGLPPNPSVYFVHSYHASAAEPSDVAAVTEHGVRFPSVVWRDNLSACQFHPEKSQKLGLAMYDNFARL
ncbi:MAG: imidazole glycerol phosphate synthase subunit HisH [Isosphaeraceae bacterium]